MTTKISYLTLFIFAVFLLRRISLAGAATCHPDDESGLLAFKSGVTRDPSGLLKTWKKGTDCCKWNGITCRDGDRVTSLSLDGQFDAVAAAGFAGKFSPALAKVQHLDSLYISYLRNLTGKFPDFLFRLPKLIIFYIEHNGLSGPIPANVGELPKELYAFSVGGNRFTGPIPSSISNLTQLNQLKLGGNQLTGTLPLGLANLKSLSYLAVDGNSLSGEIPDFFNSFTDLSYLNLSRNQFSGKIPASVASLAPNLRYLDLGHNRLSGSIPDFLGRFKTLDTLDLSWNGFTGTVPKTFSNLTKIFNLDLSRNLLIDPFPAMNVKGIESLDLSYNQFHLKSIPKWVTSSPIIYSLKLANCGIKMRFEDWKPAQTYFYDFIDLSENEISGSPLNFLNQTEYLKEFRASGNKLKFDLGKIKFAKTLTTLDLSRNSLFGKVPETVTGLQTLILNYNHLCGKLPAAAAKFPASSFTQNDCLCGSPLPPCKA